MVETKRITVGVVAMMVVIVTVSMTASTALAGGQYTGPAPDDEVHSVSENVNTWELSPLPLRADTGDATQTIENGNWFATTSNTAREIPLNRGELGIFDPGNEVDFTFDLSDTFTDSGEFENADVQVLTVRLDESHEGEVPDSRTEALEMVSTENANDNVTVVSVDSKELDGDGDLKFSHTPSESGQYFYVLAAPEEKGFQNHDGDLAIDGNVVVLGMEHVFVRSGPGHVDVSGEYEPGDDVSFDVNAKKGGDSVEQGVLLYNKDTFTASENTIEIDESSGTSIESSIGEVNGTADLEDGVGAFGATIGDGSVSETAGIGFLLDIIGEDSTDVVESGDQTLHGSITVVNGSADTTISVETFENWDEGTYQWVYFAPGDNSREVVTQTGTITLEESERNDHGNNPSNPGDPDDSDPDDSEDAGEATGPADPGTDTETETKSDTGTDDEAEEPEPASIAVTDAGLGASEIPAGDTVDVSVTLENDGGETGTTTVSIRANDETVATQAVAVDAGETISETITVTFDEAGTFEITASGTSAGTLTVSDAGTTGSTPGGAVPPEDDGGLPLVAVGVVAVLAGIAGAVYFFRIQ